jgi:hypothetical protein
MRQIYPALVVSVIILLCGSAREATAVDNEDSRATLRGLKGSTRCSGASQC